MQKNREIYRELSYGEVRLKEYYCQNALQKEKEYLLSLNADRLLAGFRAVANRPEVAKRYGGWEVTEIQGHTLGHYLSAIAQVYAYEEPKSETAQVFKEKIDYVVKDLAESQREDGYLFAWEEEIFDRVENGRPAWVPWYTMHKVFEGLLLAYELGENETALEVLKKLGDWVYNRTSKWDEELKYKVLSVEYGGMNDCLYELYKVTREERYREAASKFDELPLFENMRNKKDVLNGLHANTTIPKIVGAYNAYCATGDESYLEAAENFFDIVNDSHTYVTGGNSEWEHFGQPGILDAERTACNCETCNTYNMLKLTKGLFAVTGKKKYADFYEKTWLNAILSSQDPDTGMTMYFQPMATGYFKVYSTPFDKFWCCTGTGMENFSKLHEGIYFAKDNCIYVNRYVSSEVNCERENIAFKLASSFPAPEQVKITIDKGEAFTLCLRVPEWNSGKMKIMVNGQSDLYCISEGYISIKDLKAGDVVEAYFECEIRVSELLDNKDAVAFVYGPVVLSAKLGKEKMLTSTTGVDVTVPQRDVEVPEYIVVSGDKEQWKKDIAQNMVKADNKLEFHLNNTDQDGLVFVPHFSQHTERYGIYFNLYEEGSEELEKRRKQDAMRKDLVKEAIDTIPVGNDQYELSHAIRGYKTDVERRVGYVCRFIVEDGQLSYEINKGSAGARLWIKYCVHDEAEYELYIDDELLTKVDQEKGIPEGKEGMLVEKVADSQGEFYRIGYLLGDTYPEKVRINIKNISGQCRIYDEIYTESL